MSPRAGLAVRHRSSRGDRRCPAVAARRGPAVAARARRVDLDRRGAGARRVLGAGPRGRLGAAGGAGGPRAGARLVGARGDAVRRRRRPARHRPAPGGQPGGGSDGAITRRSAARAGRRRRCRSIAGPTAAARRSSRASSTPPAWRCPPTACSTCRAATTVPSTGCAADGRSERSSPTWAWPVAWRSRPTGRCSSATGGHDPPRAAPAPRSKRLRCCRPASPRSIWRWGRTRCSM